VAEGSTGVSAPATPHRWRGAGSCEKPACRSFASMPSSPSAGMLTAMTEAGLAGCLMSALFMAGTGGWEGCGGSGEEAGSPAAARRRARGVFAPLNPMVVYTTAAKRDELRRQYVFLPRPSSCGYPGALDRDRQLHRRWCGQASGPGFCYLARVTRAGVGGGRGGTMVVAGGVLGLGLRGSTTAKRGRRPARSDVICSSSRSVLAFRRVGGVTKLRDQGLGFNTFHGRSKATRSQVATLGLEQKIHGPRAPASRLPVLSFRAADD